VLVFAGPHTIGQLADAEQVKPPTMTKLVTGLENDGLVRRQTDRLDRRVVRVHATRKGEKVMLAGRARRVADLAARLERSTRAELLELERAAEAIERLAAAS
jgi:DNA-binding MarR family transcriptional regulator